MIFMKNIQSLANKTNNLKTKKGNRKKKTKNEKHTITSLLFNIRSYACFKRFGSGAKRTGRRSEPQRLEFEFVRQSDNGFAD
jgi:hypothetical protein